VAVSKDRGWLRALRPSFETLASQAPQDEAGDSFTSSRDETFDSIVKQHLTSVRIPAARSARVLHPFRPRSMSRGRREDRVRAAPAVSCANLHKGMRTRAYRFSGEHPAFPARWFTAYSALSLVTGLSCHHRPREVLLPTNLTPASGRQDHTASPSASRALVCRTFGVHRISSQRSRRSRPAPHSDETGRACKGDLPDM
jgi:hypothetical protein